MITVFGTVCLDRVRRVQRIPPIGGYVGVDSERWFLGGEAANTASALQAWGAEVRLVGNPLGHGELRTMIEAALRDRGIGYTAPEFDRQTPVCDVYLTPDGERTMFGMGFSELDGVPAQVFEIGDSGWLAAEPNMGETARLVVRRAVGQGRPVLLMDFYQESDPPVPGGCWQCSTDWVGARGDLQANREAVVEMARRFQCPAVLTDGAHGIHTAEPGGPARTLPPFPIDHVVDSTGAGDVFRAGLLYGLDQGWPWMRCLAFASAAGAKNCLHEGASEVVPTLAEIEAHLGAHPEVRRSYHG